MLAAPSTTHEAKYPSGSDFPYHIQQPKYKARHPADTSNPKCKDTSDLAGPVPVSLSQVQCNVPSTISAVVPWMTPSAERPKRCSHPQQPQLDRYRWPLGSQTHSLFPAGRCRSQHWQPSAHSISEARLVLTLHVMWLHPSRSSIMCLHSRLECIRSQAQHQDSPTAQQIGSCAHCT